MAKFIYCSVCGEKSQLHIKAVKNFGVVLRFIDPHTCHEEPIELDLEPQEIPMASTDRKFVEKLNELPNPHGVSTMDLRDRRTADVIKSTAPESILGQIGGLKNAGLTSNPEGDIMKDPEGD